jgi:hypothetical protein
MTYVIEKNIFKQPINNHVKAYLVYISFHLQIKFSLKEKNRSTLPDLQVLGFIMGVAVENLALLTFVHFCAALVIYVIFGYGTLICLYF